MRYRKQIVSLLAGQRHLRVEEIFNALKAEYALLSMATVYRNVKQLEQGGEIWGFLHPDGSVRYEGVNDQAHQHLVCEQCGLITEVALGFIEDLYVSLKEKTNFHLHTHRLLMIGRCVNCQ